MPIPAPHLDLASIDMGKILADPVAIREFLPHRFEMEMLSAVVHMDTANHLVVGYKDIRHDEFWVRGHFPNMPFFPGVLMLEAAAQLTAYYTLSQGFSKEKVLGLGGIEDSRFRRAVRPGERLTLVAKGHRVKPRITNFNVQGYVGTEFTFETVVIGISMAKAAE